MEITSKRFGKQSIDSNSIITFPGGLPGFEHNTRYKFFHQEGSNIIYWLQSLDDEDIIFSVALPTSFNLNYRFLLTDDDEAMLQLDNVDDLILLIMLHQSEEGQTQRQPVIKGSLKAPLIINVKTRRGLQKVLPEIEQTITLVESNNEIEITEV